MISTNDLLKKERDEGDDNLTFQNMFVQSYFRTCFGWCFITPWDVTE